MAAFAFVLFGVVAFGYLIVPLVDVPFRDPAAPKPPGHRVRRVIGFAIAAAGLSILFLNVSASGILPDELGGKFHVACGTALRAMFSKDAGVQPACANAAYPRLWIAGSVVAVGMGIAFWGASRGRLLSIVGYALLATVVVGVLALIEAGSFEG